MSPLSTTATVLAASTVTTIGATLVVLLIIGLLIYVWVNIRSGRAEIGSEIELAPNRKPYYDDDELETTVLNRTLRWALVLLVVVAVGLPLYWLNEPSRQSGAVENFQATFVRRGQELYETGSQCQNCHGPEGTGGVAPYTISDADGEFVASVSWLAPALNTVLLRFDEDEVRYIIDYGRPFSPMPGWGASVNKGPLTDQQISNIIDYLASIQLSSEESQQEVAASIVDGLGLAGESPTEDELQAAIDEIDYADPAVGEYLFSNTAASGAFSCARCHTRGWSVVVNEESALAPGAELEGTYIGFPPGSGAFGPNITGGLIPKKFASFEELVAFLTIGSQNGEQYGTNGIGSGRMPGFGDNPNTEVEGDGMMTPEMVEAIAAYANELPAAETPSPEGAPTNDQLSDVENAADQQEEG